MQNGSNNNFCLIRTAPGAGRNFLASLLNNHHYGDPFLIHYSQTYNEYFNTPVMVVDPDGPYIIPFWSDNAWQLITTRATISNELSFRIRTDHGRGSKTINNIKNATDGYYVTVETNEEINIVSKLIFIKKHLGVRPLVLFSQNESSFNNDELQTLKSFLSNNKNWLLDSNFYSNDLIYNISQWSVYVEFFKQIPHSYAFSSLNFSYFINNYKKEPSMVSYLSYYEYYKNTDMEKYKREELFDIDISPTLKRISYKSLFLDCDNTNSVFDNFKDEIKEYTKRNLELVENIENFFGEIVI
tara:strand:- start:3676 stop:4572 length:897 start_codon:yes stop_codon:yes gene_type:complete